MALTPFGQMDPQMLAQVLGGAPELDAQAKMLADQLKQSQQFAQPLQVQRTTPVGAGFSAIANMIRAGVGGARAGDARRKLLGVQKQQTQQDALFNQALMGAGAPAPAAAPPLLLRRPGTPGAPPPAGMMDAGPQREPQVQPAESRTDMLTRLGFLASSTGRKDQADALLGQARFEAERAEKADTAKAAAGEKISTLENSLRGEMQKNQRIGLLQNTGDFLQQIVGAGRTKNGDLTRLYGMAKLLDPTGSVRDADVEQQIKTGGLQGQVQAWFSQMNDDGTFPDRVRKEMATEARRIYADRRAAAEPVRKQYRKLAEELGANPDHVDLDLGLDEPLKKTAAPPGGKSTQPEAFQDADGKTWRLQPNGKYRAE